MGKGAVILAKTGRSARGGTGLALYAGLAALSFALAAFANIDVGMGAGMSLHLMDIALHPAARYAKPTAILLIFVLPVGIGFALRGELFMLPMIVIVRLVSALFVSKAYRELPASAKNRSVLPLLVHGFWLLLGVSLYDAFMFGLVRSLIGALVGIVEWVAAGSLSVALMRQLTRLIRPVDDDEEETA